MFKRNSIFFVLLLVAINLLGQNTASISIDANNSVSGNEYFIDILVKNGSIKILFKLKDSVSRNLEYDKEWIKYRKLILKSEDFDSKSDTDRQLMMTASAIRQKYIYYSIDSLSLSYQEVPSYVDVLNQVLASSAETLENKAKNKNRFVLDGTLMRVTIVNNAITQTVYAHSPGNESHPLLYSLISQTLNLYRERSGALGLTKQRTSGY